jgi:TRAP-type mannitol/chloroaromatic compound transport system substrate-binding protein
MKRREFLQVGGAVLRPFPPEVMDACYKAALDTYAEHSSTNPLFKKIYDSVNAFRADSSIWLQIAELSFDGFMIRTRTRT